MLIVDFTIIVRFSFKDTVNSAFPLDLLGIASAFIPYPMILHHFLFISAAVIDRFSLFLNDFGITMTPFCNTQRMRIWAGVQETAFSLEFILILVLRKENELFFKENRIMKQFLKWLFFLHACFKDVCLSFIYHGNDSKNC